MLPNHTFWAKRRSLKMSGSICQESTIRFTYSEFKLDKCDYTIVMDIQKIYVNLLLILIFIINIIKYSTLLYQKKLFSPLHYIRII